MFSQEELKVFLICKGLTKEEMEVLLRGKI
jgi:hypothetical protein